MEQVERADVQGRRYRQRGSAGEESFREVQPGLSVVQARVDVGLGDVPQARRSCDLGHLHDEHASRAPRPRRVRRPGRARCPVLELEVLPATGRGMPEGLGLRVDAGPEVGLEVAALERVEERGREHGGELLPVEQVLLDRAPGHVRPDVPPIRVVAEERGHVRAASRRRPTARPRAGRPRRARRSGRGRTGRRRTRARCRPRAGSGRGATPPDVVGERALAVIGRDDQRVPARVEIVQLRRRAGRAARRRRGARRRSSGRTSRRHGPCSRVPCS